MKKTLALLPGLLFLVLCADAQKMNKASSSDKKKGDLVGIAFTLTDFNAPKNFGSSNATSIGVSQMSAGLSVSYWKGLTSKIDVSSKLNVVFHDYALRYNGKSGKTEMGIELEPTINIRPIKDENLWAPFLTAGAGIGLYTGRFGAYVPLGVGLQLNASSNTYFFLQGQYKVSLTKDVMPDNVFYSIGFAQNISR